ncbi:ABC-type nitrate/sulfonate/bicarbonate transport system substrate-binding protein [Natronobacillus azotifigens]|uniref:ABC transporter substrate-binding protein n=1 Tax=Natronobacillus azotifigens TaxID=472978 RepID=A0A9J6R7P7_9BACI|nr:ABC transporter substrate-binding protein [Natronobacillus azotifigens]MCZ0701645.1 ABC transporter substrate-binding protein [Natronobacillus azotifigens]
MKKNSLLWLVMLLFVITACGNAEGINQTEGMESVSIVLDWTPNTNHTGLYVAEAKGYFEEEGLDVDIILPGESGADQFVASGQADFGISSQQAVTEARIQDIPLVSVAAIIQNNTSGFASPVDKGISSPADYANRTYGGYGAPIESAFLGALMEEENASVDDVEIMNIGNTDFFTAFERDVDFIWIYYGWTGIEAEVRGIELKVQYLNEYSEELDYHTPVITTNERMIKDKSEVIKRFLSAVSKGYQDAITKPEESASLLLDAVPDLDADLVHASQVWLADKYQADAEQWGIQSETVWNNFANWMLNNDLLDEELDIQEAFTNDYLPQ